MADEALTVLLALEAADRASAIVNGAGAAMANLRTKILGVTAASEEEQAAAAESTNALSGMSGLMMGATVAGAALAVGLGLVAEKSVEAAASFQQSQTALVTGAGESAKAMQTVQQGVLDMAGQVGVGAKKLSDDLYLVESAGYHGQAGLDVLRAAEEGAKADMADAATVADALTTELNAYHEGAGRATNVTNEMVTAVALGKMHMQDFAGSLSAVLPVAAAAHIQFSEIAAAEATMTAQGMSAQQSAQDLANTIRSLQAPNGTAIQEMQQLGLSSNDVSDNLGKRGLVGTMELLTETITSHLGPAGDVILSTFRSSQQAAANARQEIAAMPPELQKLAQAFLNGQVTAKQWRTDLQALTPEQQHLMQQFAQTAEQTKSFQQALTSGSPAAQTYSAALEKMLGGSTGLNTALMLTGGNMDTFSENANAVAEAGQKGGKNIQDWGAIQGNFNQQMDQAKAAVGAASIAVGMGLLPMLTAAAKAVVPIISAFATWVSHNQTLAATILLVVGGLGALATVIMTLAVVWGVLTAVEYASLLPIALIVLAVVAVIAVVVLLVTHWSQVVAFLRGAWQEASSAAVGAFHAIASAIGGFVSGVLSAVGGFFSRLGSAASAAWQEFSRHPLYWIGYLLTFVPTKLAELLKAFVVWAAQHLAALATWSLQMAEKGFEAAVNFGIRVLDELGRLPGQVWNVLVRMVTQLGPWSLQMAQRGGQAILDFAKALSDEWNKLPDQAWTLGVQIVEGVIGGIKSMVSAGVGALSDLVHGMIAGAKAAAGNPQSPAPATIPLGLSLAEGVEYGVRSRAGSAADAMRGLVGGIIGVGGSASPGVGAGQGVIASSAATGGSSSSSPELIALLAGIHQQLTAINGKTVDPRTLPGQPVSATGLVGAGLTRLLTQT